ncbi:hypothetical protein BJ170DRAFT_687763 [Xylariales sp. AK1849]|nr:hypothetical protein BJ170DRAFT_687763 [Xylariales sp. AK1849]
MANHNNNGSWAATPTESADSGLQVRPMGLKINYTFDKDSLVNCLARWPYILQVQTIPLNESNSIGVVDLKTCLQAVAQCSPELAVDSERDYTVYAFDYSEQDTPLVGQGMLCRALEDCNGSASQQLVTGRVTQNLLAIFGNGIRETLEVRLKLTAVPKVARANTMAPAAVNNPIPMPSSLVRTASTMSETNEWNALLQSNPNLGHTRNVSSVSSPILGPVRPFNSAYEARNETMGPNPQIGPTYPASRPGSRLSSMEPNSQSKGQFTRTAAPLDAVGQAPAQDSTSGPPVDSHTKTQSRSASRASSRAPTGKPRGRPRKKPLPREGSTSGYEDGTDAEEQQAPKKRAKTTKVERSNTATFGSAPESLRVVASTAGSLRNFRPIALGGDGQASSHLQEVPRAPTPVPDRRQPSLPYVHPAPPSNLRRQSMSTDQDASFTSSYTEVNRSMSQLQDARSPVESIAHTPYNYSEGPSPADIGSSPPVPRSVMYSVRSSPAPSSPILPPMPAPQLHDSGFMSGGFEGSRLDEEDANKPVAQAPPPDAAVAKPKLKSKPKPRKSRAKKKVQPLAEEISGDVDTLIMHAETPGPAELLPTTSLYNPPPRPCPPPNRRRNSEIPSSLTVTEQAALPPLPSVAHEALTPAPAGLPPVMQHDVLSRMQIAASEEPGPVVPSAMTHQPSLPPMPIATSKESTPAYQSQPPATVSPEKNVSETDYDALERALMDGLCDEQQPFGAVGMDARSFTEDEGQDARNGTVKLTIEQPDASMEPPPVPRCSEEAIAPEPEPELPLPMVAASDPVFPQMASVPGSEPAHPMTDVIGYFDGQFNKNYAKKQIIKQRLEEAIAAGQMPPFCTNCGAIETPTWRKIWKQELEGAPCFHDYSEKPGHVTAINVLKRDEQGMVTRYEMIKKSLGPRDDKDAWTEVLLCNPCGIWFTKWKTQRPPERWEKDGDRLGKPRSKRGARGERAPRPKKPRTQSYTQNYTQSYLTSDLYLPTDPLGPVDGAPSPMNGLPYPFSSFPPPGNGQNGNSANLQGPGSTHSRASTHSRGSGTPGSPIALDDELGATRRLLFPSPRKDGESRILGEVAVNIVQTSPDFREPKQVGSAAEKENSGVIVHDKDDDMADLFGTPMPPRPATPPPKSANSGPFKTPTRPTPSHRPVTRSVTKSITNSIRSSQSIKSPSQLLAMLQRTPSKTPRSSAIPSSASRRRSPRHGGLPSHFLDDGNTLESPFTRSINQLLSEANDFMAPTSPNLLDLDLGNLPDLGSDVNLAPGGHFDFGNLLSTDGMMPSSPPVLRHGHMSVAFGGHLAYDAGSDMWRHLNVIGMENGMVEEDTGESVELVMTKAEPSS